MTQEARCPKCGSAELIPNVGIVDSYGSGTLEKGPLQAEVQEQPDAWVFKRGKQADLKATICGQCGFAELYVLNPHQLVEAHQKWLQSQSPPFP